jgi:malonyl-CoA O-methyltransferase
MSLEGIAFALPDERSARRGFAKASKTFDDADVVHAYARDALLGRLDYLKLDPRAIADIGCGTGKGLIELRRRFPSSLVLGIDSSIEMCREAAARAGAEAHIVVGNVERAPVRAGTIDLIVANLVLPWCNAEQLFAEAARVLSAQGLLLFSTLGPDTLGEVRRAWARVDSEIHVHAAFDMHDLGDLAAAAGLAEPVVSAERIQLTYGHVDSLVRDLRACGGVNAAAGRRKTLTGPRRWQRFAREIGENAAERRLAITVELIYGSAWGRGHRPGKRVPPRTETAVPLDAIGRSSRE